jgi:hypothetical protein
MAERRVVIAHCPACGDATWFTRRWFLTTNESVTCWTCHSADFVLTPVLLDPSGRGEPLHKLPAANRERTSESTPAAKQGQTGSSDTSRDAKDPA